MIVNDLFWNGKKNGQPLMFGKMKRTLPMRAKREYPSTIVGAHVGHHALKTWHFLVLPPGSHQFSWYKTEICLSSQCCHIPRQHISARECTGWIGLWNARRGGVFNRHASIEPNRCANDSRLSGIVYRLLGKLNSSLHSPSVCRTRIYCLYRIDNNCSNCAIPKSKLSASQSFSWGNEKSSHNRCRRRHCHPLISIAANLKCIPTAIRWWLWKMVSISCTGLRVKLVRTYCGETLTDTWYNQWTIPATPISNQQHPSKKQWTKPKKAMDTFSTANDFHWHQPNQWLSQP